MTRQSPKFIFTTARITIMRAMLAQERTFGEIAEHLGTTRTMVRAAAQKEGLIAMTTGYQVVVSDTANPKRREWVETARGSQEGRELCDYLNPRLPEGKRATSQWEAFDPEMPRFDPAKLTERANEPPQEEAP